ncbi:MAG: PLDc N-terminal domain-containing protein [Leptospira sp.]|nr:PLDc N-terminal domain-containing protein [Leptospira sp.]
MENNFANPNFWTYFIGSYAYYLPFVLTTVWAPLALFDLSQSEQKTSYHYLLWSSVILLIPVFGGAIYFISQKTEFSSQFKKVAIGGGLGILLLVWILSIGLHV